MTHINDLKDLKIYRSNNKMYIPLSDNNNKNGSLIYLLTPSIESSINMINSNSILNRNWFRSYYIDKSINAIIKNDNTIEEFSKFEDNDLKLLIENKLSSKDRKKLNTKDFGIPSKRSYPLNDEEHVRQAIRMFNHCDAEDEKTLANNIIKKIKQFNMTEIDVGEDNRFYKYYHSLKEYEYKISGAFPIEYLTDYRFKYWDTNKEIKKEVKECSSLIQDTKDYVQFGKMTDNIKFLAKCYYETELAGFATAYKDLANNILEYGIFLKDEYFDDEDAKLEITKYFIYLYRDYMFSNQTKKKIVKVYSMNRDKQLIKDLRTSLIRDGSFIDRAKAFQLLNISINVNKIQFPEAYVDIEKFGVSDSKVKSNIKVTMTESCMNNCGILSNNKAYFFDNEIFQEDFADTTLKKYLYDERIRTQKELIDVYKLVRTECPVIKYTKTDISLYKGMNLFFDISYYHKIFLYKNSFNGERAVTLYTETLSRLLNNKSVDSRYSVKTIFIPVYDYFNKDEDIFDYKKNLNPISIITRLIRRNDFEKINKIFKDTNIIFFGSSGYFKLNFSTFEKSKLNKFISNINNLIDKIVPEDDDMTKDSKNAIITDIVSNIEKSQNIELYNALGNTLRKKNQDEQQSKELNKKKDDTQKSKTSDKVKKVTPNDKNNIPKSEKEIEKEIVNDKKKEVIDKIAQAAETSTSTKDALDKLNNDEFIASLIQDIAEEESNEVKISATRKARISSLNDEVTKKSIKGRTVKELLEESNDGTENVLPTTSANINSINNDQWDNLQFINFNNDYNVDADIMSVLKFFGTRTIPVGIRDINVEDTTTTEDLKETWNVNLEDIYGTRFSLKFDIPKLKNNRLMRLRGNDKTINAQLMNLPIIKTESDTAQITTNYNKIFFYTFGNSLGKSNVVTSKIVKALQKYDGNRITVRTGSNNLTALKYEIPLDYADLGSGYSYIKYNDVTFYFDQDEIREKYSDIINMRNGLPIGYDSKYKSIIYSDGSVLCSNIIAKYLMSDPKFNELYNEAKPSVKYTYSQASILNTKIPVVVICAYCEGLIKTLNRAGIEYEISDKREKYDVTTHDCIRFNDGYIIYKIDYNSSMLMNGLKECDTEDYSIKEINNKTMWTEQLDNFGGRIKADGLDNFYDLMFDPMTCRVCETCKIPSEFCQGLIYASNLLSDTKYNKHTDITSNRLRTNEIIAGYTYKVLARSYAEYRTKLKKSGKATMTVKQTAIIDEILADSTCSDMSTSNDLNYADSANTVSFKGLSGLNSDRSYSLDKRTYDDSMSNILGMSTGFAGTVGVTRVATTNASINGTRGYISDSSNKPMNDVNTMTIGENLTPMCSTHDDPFREAMSYVQRQKHDMRVANGDPLLITNGMDDALSSFTPDYFSFNAKENGRIIERDDHNIVIQYNSGSIDYVDLDNNIYKNSDGGFYTSIKLKPVDKLGTTVKKGQLIAYDPLSYNTETGYDDNATYNQGTLAKVAIITSDKGFEDSCVVSSYISDALSTDIVMQISIPIPKTTNVFNLVKIGDPVQEGDPLLIMQNSYEDNDVNILLKNLIDDEDEVTSLGRIPIKSHNTGRIEDIKIYRTCDIEGMSPSLKKIVTDYEKEKNRKSKQLQKYDETKAKEYHVDKLEQTGKLKNIEDGLLIEIYVSYKDDFSVGDKLIFLGAQKGVAKEVIPDDLAPTSSYRPDEPIDAIASIVSFDKRMCCAPLQYTMMGKGLVELDRQVKDIMGIKQDYTIRHKK